MTRTISRSLAGVLERLELEQPTLVATADLGHVLSELGIKTPVRVVAARLRDRGWLLSTDRAGVWEFAPAALAGAYPSHDPLMPLRVVLVRHPQTCCALTLQTAAWALGIADRLPNRPEVAIDSLSHSNRFPESLSVLVYKPTLSPIEAKGVPALTPESIIVHMASKPTDVRSWQSALEWLPDLAAELDIEKLLAELQGRSKTAVARTGYLLQGLRPDLSRRIYQGIGALTKTWFGPRGSLRHHDNHWLIADTILPFDPRELGEVSWR
ncbi:MAG: type IV toxin-antitoxin system AbiEi family antitoxin [Coriobacteriia bacterium]|nr:type IV toxin-antitoxin system AbiEi family antitoxin [Coriobacteriia bacterium]